MALGMMGDDLDWTEERGMACAMSPPDFADGSVAERAKASRDAVSS